MVSLLSATAVGQAAPAVSQEDAAIADVGVLAGCEPWDWGPLCGTVINATSRGFHVTLDWPQLWGASAWVGPYSRLGGGGIDVDGVYVGSGCSMSGVINGGVYNYPFIWGSGWHQIHTNETAYINIHLC
jgi:hypothetical protein